MQSSKPLALNGFDIFQLTDLFIQLFPKTDGFIGK